MGYCEDWPCCGHERGCCPDYDESGRQLNMVCVCGAKLPVDNPVSICNACLRRDDEYDAEYDDDDEEWEADEEYRRDEMLAQQELEDFEQADEYFTGGCDYGEW